MEEGVAPARIALSDGRSGLPQGLVGGLSGPQALDEDLEELQRGLDLDVGVGEEHHLGSTDERRASKVSRSGVAGHARSAGGPAGEEADHGRQRDPLDLRASQRTVGQLDKNRGRPERVVSSMAQDRHDVPLRLETQRFAASLFSLEQHAEVGLADQLPQAL